MRTMTISTGNYQSAAVKWADVLTPGAVLAAIFFITLLPQKAHASDSIAALRAEIETLRKENAALRERYRLGKENAALRERAATIGNVSPDIGTSLNAAASDAMARGISPASPIFTAPSWTGLYVGVGVGVRSTETDANVTRFQFNTANVNCPGCSDGQPLNDSAFRVSPYIGYNWQTGRQWVVGIEGDFGWSDKTTTLPGMIYPGHGLISGAGGDTFNVKANWDASIRGRAGFLITPTTLLYATAGAAWLHVESTSCNSVGQLGYLSCRADVASPVTINNTDTLAGWTLGAGIEAMIAPNWIARGEYRYADYGAVSNTDLRSIVGGGDLAVFSYDLGIKSHTATFGLAYKFGSDMVAGHTGGALAYAQAAPIVLSWTGTYIGAGVGFRSTLSDANVTDMVSGGRTLASNCASYSLCVTGLPLNDTAFKIGPYAGVNWQISPQWVVGLEGDWGWADTTTTRAGMSYPLSGWMTQTADNTFSVKTEWDATIRARAGVLINPSLLAYATAGVAWLSMESTSTCSTYINELCEPGGLPGRSPSVIKNSDIMTGWTIGGGIEAMMWGNWIARGEYRYADYGTASATNTRVGTPTEMVAYDLQVKSHTATFGVAYKFGREDPVVVKY